MTSLCLDASASIFVVNLAIAACVACAMGLLGTRLMHRREAPLRHSFLVVAIGLTMFSPLFVLISTSFGLGIVSIAPSEAAEKDLPAASARQVAGDAPPPADHLAHEPEVYQQPVESDIAPPVDHTVVASDISPPPIEADTSVPVTVLETRRLPNAPSLWRESSSPVAQPSRDGRSGDIALTTLVAVWTAGMLLYLARFARGLSLVRRLRRSLVRVTDPRLNRVALSAYESLGLHRDSVFESPHVSMPVTLGLFRPVIVFPEGLGESLDEDELSCVLLHEAAHVKRYDTWVGLLQRLVGAVYWWNPLLYLVNRHVTRLREQICDDHVIASHGDGRPLAKAILKVAQWSTGSVALPCGAALASEVEELSERINRLTEKDPDTALGLNRKALNLVVMYSLLLCAALLFTTLRIGTAQAAEGRGTASAATRAAGDRAKREQAKSDKKRRKRVERVGSGRPAPPATTAKTKATAGLGKSISDSLEAGAVVPENIDPPTPLASQEATARLKEFIPESLAASDVTEIRQLIEKGADVNVTNGYGTTLLYTASQMNHPEIVQLLLKSKADVDIAQKSGRTPLYIASLAGHTEIIKLLLEAGADVSAAHVNSGETSLYVASYRGDAENVRLLIEAGAEINVVATINGRSNTPSGIARIWGHTEVVRLLEAARVKVESDKYLTLDLGKGVTMKLLLAPAGQFTMGSPDDEKDRQSDEGPRRQVTISRPFYIGTTVVTQDQWKAVMNTQPWHGRPDVQVGGDNAASWITFNDATAFCAALARKTARTVRMPNEAEWEYACRAGTTTAFSFGDDSSKLGDYAWYLGNAQEENERYAHAVGVKKPNAWGLYDMHGNTWEWCADRYGSYANADLRDPKGAATGKYYVLRGGSWNNAPDGCRAAYRGKTPPGFLSANYAFRVVVEYHDDGSVR